MMHWLILPVFSAILVGVISLGSFQLGKLQALREIDQEVAAAKEAQRTKEADLQASMDKLREDKNRELARLNRHVRNLSDSLRNRPERPASGSSAQVGDGATGCTGSGLYKSDGTFLIGEAARADQLRIALKACQDAYENASR